MPYIDEQYYNDVFHGEPVDDADFPSLLDVYKRQQVGRVAPWILVRFQVLLLPETAPINILPIKHLAAAGCFCCT